MSNLTYVDSCTDCDSLPLIASFIRYVYSELHKRGMYGGLWTSTDMPNIAAEVGVAGSRVCKTDVGWIGAGYKYASDEVELRVGSHGLRP